MKASMLNYYTEVKFLFIAFAYNKWCNKEQNTIFGCITGGDSGNFDAEDGIVP